MAAKLPVSRRVSASTTAPMAPAASSSHMNQNRSCPGVPNRYSSRWSDSVIRPKSIATVVVVLSPTPDTSSTPTPRSVSGSSVCRGLISLIEPTIVALPTPNPPAMSILVVTRGRAVMPAASEGAQAIESLPQQSLGRTAALGVLHRVDHRDQALVPEVAQQNADDADRETEVGRQVDDR